MTTENTAPDEVNFPRLDVRIFAGVYSNSRIRFASDEQDSSDESDWTVVFEKPFVDERLTDECKKFLLSFAVDQSLQMGLYMCLVYDENDRIFIEPDGKTSRLYWPAIKRDQEIGKQANEWKDRFESWIPVPGLERVESSWILPLLIDPKLTADIEQGLRQWRKHKLKIKEYTDLFQRAINSGLLVELDPDCRKFGLHLINLRRCSIPVSPN